MIKKNREKIKLLNVISDTIIVIVAYLLAMWTRYSLLNGAITVDPYQTKFLIVIALIGLVMSIVYQAVHYSYLAMAFVTFVGTLAVMSMFFVYRYMDFSRLSLVIFFGITSVLVIFKHIIGHKLVENNTSLGYGKKTVAIVGNGLTADKCKADIKKYFPSYKIVSLESNCSNIDEIIIACDANEIDAVPSVLALADKEGLHVSMVPFYSDYIPSHPEIETIGSTKLINMRSTPLDNIGNAFVKRFGDIILSAFAIVILSPMMLFTAIGVVISSPGPILFKQERVGKDKKPFNMLKFRSMRVNNEENTAWSKNVDSRRTAFGSFIRKYSIDELPQLFNVFLGDMTLVGPRPEIPYFVEQFRDTIPLYLVRQQVRPGMTGWAQVNDLRGDTSIKDRVEHDIWYIENWSLGLDIKILFMTVFGGKFKNSEK